MAFNTIHVFNLCLLSSCMFATEGKSLTCQNSKVVQLKRQLIFKNSIIAFLLTSCHCGPLNIHKSGGKTSPRSLSHPIYLLQKKCEISQQPLHLLMIFKTNLIPSCSTWSIPKPNQSPKHPPTQEKFTLATKIQNQQILRQT